MCSIMLVSSFAPKKPARLYGGKSIVRAQTTEPDAIEMDSLENFELSEPVESEVCENLKNEKSTAWPHLMI